MQSLLSGITGMLSRKANLDNFPKNWKGVREIILSEIDLLAIGNLVSIVWTISEQPPSHYCKSWEDEAKYHPRRMARGLLFCLTFSFKRQR